MKILIKLQICGDEKCGNLNFSHRTECNRCHKPKEISKRKDSKEFKPKGFRVNPDD